MKINARLVLKLIIAIPALIDLGKRGAAAGRAIVDVIKPSVVEEPSPGRADQQREKSSG